MKNRLKTALLASAMLAALLVPLSAPAFAQTTPPPAKPATAIETYDYYAIDPLQKISSNVFIGNIHGFRYRGNMDAIATGPLASLDTTLQAFLAAYTATTNTALANMDTNVKSMLDLLIAELPTATGPLGGGSVPPLYHTPADQALRVTVPDFGNMTEVLRTTGAVAAPALVPIMASAITRYKLEDTIIVDVSGPASLYKTADARSHMASSAVTASAVAEYAFKSASDSTGRLNPYIDAIATSRDIKNSFDLRSRVMLELLQQHNELVRTTAGMASVNTNYMMLNLRTD